MKRVPINLMELTGVSPMTKIVTVVGARPQFIKVAPVSRCLASWCKEVLVHTGQHYDPAMSDVFFEELGIAPPDYHLNVGSGPHGVQTGRMLEAIEGILLKENPQAVLVYGDTNSTLAGALAAAKLHIPLVHVEAGLRSFNRHMPEEINRVVTDHVSTWLFCPTGVAVGHLRSEGITQGVYTVGDVMIDAVMWASSQGLGDDSYLSQLCGARYALATVHRAENTDDLSRMREICRGLGALPIRVIWPVHPRSRKVLEAYPELLALLGENVRLVEPCSFLEMVFLEKHAQIILTDSGGVQKEAHFFRVPCITLREESEWVETIETGWNVLVGADAAAIVEQGSRALAIGPTKWTPLYGDGQAASHISGILRKCLGLC
jgi:UDP-GlcNAc3NAcA epimerase